MRVLLGLLVLLVHLPMAHADDRQALERLVTSFLAAADDKAAHQRFWTDDLVYTSSSGERFGKAEILAGFDVTKDDASDAAAPARYGAEDLSVRLLDDVAVVTFRLTADQGEARVGEYFNTGVFRHTTRGWAAMTWQATKIPLDEPN